MKLALYHNLTSGGSKREAHELARRLVSNGHTVHLFCPETANEQFLSLHGIVQSEFKFDFTLVPDLPIRLPGLSRYVDLVGLMVNLRRLKRVAQRIASAIDGGGYDFTLAHHDRIVQSPYLLRYVKTRPLYYCAEPMRSFYDPPIDRPYGQPQSRSDRLQANWYKPATLARRAVIKAEDRRNARKASKLLTNSFFTAESIYRAYSVRAKTVHLGVDEAKFKMLSVPKSNYVLSVGAVSPRKEFDFIISALGILPPSRRPDLVIVGNTASPAEQQYLERMAAKRRVGLKILVDVSEGELVELFNRARVFVYAPQLEPFGLAPLEAMSCGVPVVAVQEGGVRESVVHGVTGFLVERVPEAFAAQVEELICNQARCDAMGRNGREHILSYWTWGHAARRFERAVVETAKLEA